MQVVAQITNDLRPIVLLAVNLFNPQTCQPPLEKQLYLVGTVHLDVDGPTRLMKVFEGLKPAYIAVELAENHSFADINTISGDDIYDQVMSYCIGDMKSDTFRDFTRELAGAVLFEARTAKAYSDLTGCQLHAIDLPSRAPKPVTPRNRMVRASMVGLALAAATGNPRQYWDTYIQRHYDIDLSGPLHVTPEQQAALKKQDSHMAGKVWDIYTGAEGPVVVVTGRYHTHSIQELLERKGLESEVIRLDRYQVFE